MSTINIGGPAFPTTDPNYEQRYASEGMSMRDYFAAKALPAAYMLGTPYSPECWASMARTAYLLADAMLAERKKS